MNCIGHNLYPYCVRLNYIYLRLTLSYFHSNAVISVISASRIIPFFSIYRNSIFSQSLLIVAKKPISPQINTFLLTWLIISSSNFLFPQVYSCRLHNALRTIIETNSTQLFLKTIGKPFLTRLVEFRRNFSLSIFYTNIRYTSVILYVTTNAY